MATIEVLPPTTVDPTEAEPALELADLTLVLANAVAALGSLLASGDLAVFGPVISFLMG